MQAVSGPAWAGPHPGRGSHGDGRCWSDVVFSDSVTVAYVPSRRAEAAAPPSFRIPLIAHELAPPARQAAACHHDVTCHPGWKSAWGWQSPAIAMLRVERRAGTSQFSGTLVNLGLVFRLRRSAVLFPTMIRYIVTILNRIVSCRIVWESESIWYGEPCLRAGAPFAKLARPGLERSN